MDIAELFGSFALATVFAVVLLQQLGAPIPAAPVLVLAGASAVAQPLQGVYALALAVAASGLGTLPWFYAGRRYGYRVLELVCRVSSSADSCVRKTESAFARYGVASLVAAKFIPGVFRLAPPLGRLAELGGIGAMVAASALATYAAFRLVNRRRFLRTLRAAEATRNSAL